MEEQGLDILNEMSGDHSGSEEETTSLDDHGVHLPACLGYFSLGFKFISTTIIVLMAGWVVLTIITTKRLHKPHNIYVAYLLVIDIMFASTNTVLSGAMIIGYFTGVGDFIGCNVFIFMLHPTGIIFLTFLVMSIDKVLAVTFPLRHHVIMKPRVTFGVIVAIHVFAVMMYSRNLFGSDRYTKIAQFGTCAINNSAFFEIFITVTIPSFSTCVITVILDFYLTIKAYQVHKQIQEESKLSGGHSGDSDQLKALKKEQVTVKKHLKPMITLLVVMMGHTFFGLLYPILLIFTVHLETPVTYESFKKYIISPNIGYIMFLLHPLVYGLYFKQVREPMMSLLKRITCPCKCKSAKVAPQPQRSRIVTWIHQY